MQQINEIIANGAISILVILLGIVVKSIKDYLIKKGGEQTVKIVEILAKNAVNAVEQVASETGLIQSTRMNLDRYHVYQSGTHRYDLYNLQARLQ